MCPDGLSYNSSKNHDSCSISSFNISLAMSYVAGSLPIVKLHNLFQFTIAPCSAFKHFFSISFKSVLLGEVVEGIHNRTLL